MGRCIVKLNDGERDWYLEWSTVVDAPVTYGMTLDEMKAYRLEKTGTDGMRDWDEVIKRIEDAGVSWADGYGETADSTIVCNRAGVGETFLTREQIISMYCHRTGDVQGTEDTNEEEE